MELGLTLSPRCPVPKPEHHPKHRTAELQIRASASAPDRHDRHDGQCHDLALLALRQVTLVTLVTLVTR
jgi:hypothetical protein